MFKHHTGKKIKKYILMITTSYYSAMLEGLQGINTESRRVSHVNLHSQEYHASFPSITK